MSKLLKCDGCGGTTPEDGSIGWVRVENASAVEISGWDDPRMPMHTCSAQCTYDAVNRLSWMAELSRSRDG